MNDHDDSIRKILGDIRLLKMRAPKEGDKSSPESQ